jgi:predicted ATPase
MLALYRSGRQAEALEVYRDARQILVEDAGVEPGAELQRVHAGILRQDPSLDIATPAVKLPCGVGADATSPGGPDVPVAPGAARQSALPPSPNRTIGRSREVGSVSERVRSGSVRLLTLTGPGGVGKTRLALDAARAVELDFADGARFVSLAAVDRPQDVPAAIVSALAITPPAGESADQSVERFLAAKHLLLVVDNCEHLPAAAAFIGGIAVACPDVTMLATSREPLAVQAEHCYPVSPLTLPERGTHPEAMSSVDAVVLFYERARAHDSGFDVGDGNIEAIAEICRRVDGLPLAIELAAARCGLLSPGEIATRLHGALDGLGAGPRDAPVRQQTLRATIDWSHSLLADDERTCFAHFAVFGGGATVEAAETITGADIDALERLVAKSLLVRRQSARRPSRLDMLETIRTYAAERLATLDRRSVRERHYRYFLTLAQQHGNDRALFGPAQNDHLALLDGEIENLHGALAYALGQESAGPALELCAALGSYWLIRDRYADALDAIDQALSKPAADGLPALRVHALVIKAWALWPLGRRAEQAEVMAQAEASARALRNPLVLSEVLETRALQTGWDGRYDLATAFADEALVWARAAENGWAFAQAAKARALASGDAAQLRERVDEAALLLEEVGNVHHLAHLLTTAAYWALRDGSDREAMEFLERAIPLAREQGNPYVWMLLCGKLGLAALLSGDIEAAHSAFCEQLTLCRELVVLPVAFEGVIGLAGVAAVREDFDRAARLVGASASHRYSEPLDAVDARLRETFFKPARARSGGDAWDGAVRKGAALSFKEAIAYALDESREQAGSPGLNSPARAGSRPIA